MSELIVPTHVNALRVDKPQRVIGPPSDFEILPWFGSGRDHNSNTPHIASAINAEPFSDHELWLETGIHLHWTLPDGLTRGSTRRSPVRSIRVGDLWFPPAPNRWLVIRQSTAPTDKENVGNRAWLVESDYVHTGTDRPKSNPIAYPRNNRDLNQPPFLYLGRQIVLDPVTFESGAKSMTPATSLSTYDHPLTALGPGDPLFAAHYPSCRSVFGLLDSKPPEPDHEVWYDVYGWYSQHVADPLGEMVAAMYQDIEGTISLLARDAHESEKAEKLKIKPGAKRLSKTHWGIASSLLMREQFGWAAFKDLTEVPKNILCHARVTIDPKEPKQALAKPTKGAIGFGSSAPEAFAAFLSGPASASLDEMQEDRLVQALAATDLANHSLDLGQKLKEARHNEQFKGYKGHAIWVVRPEQNNTDSVALGETTAVKSISLPDNLAHELNRLNELQEEFDDQQVKIEGLKQELFADWHHYMRAVYPEGDADPFSADVDALRELIERTRLQPLEELQHETGSLFHGTSPSGNMVLTDRAPPPEKIRKTGAPLPELNFVGGESNNYYRYFNQTVEDLLADTPDATDPKEPFYGGIDGEYHTDALGQGERIIEIEVDAGSIISAIRVKTNKQQLPRYGKPGDNSDQRPPSGGIASTEIEDAVRRGIFSSKIELEERVLGPNRSRLIYNLRKDVSRHKIKMSEGEFIVAISGRTADFSGTLVFIELSMETNTGRILGPWGTATFGRDKQDFRIDVPSGHSIAELRCKAGRFLYGFGILTIPVDIPKNPEDEEEPVQEETNPNSLAAAVVRQHRAVLATLRKVDGSSADLHIGLTPGPRYWQPHDPVIVLKDDHVRPRERHGHDGHHMQTREDSTSAYSATYATKLSNGWRSGNRFVGNARAPWDVRKINFLMSVSGGWTVTQGSDTWDPLQLEWEVEVSPLLSGGNTTNGEYTTRFVTGSQKLRLDHADLEPTKDGAHVARTYQYLSGRSILNPSVGRLLAKRIEGLPDDIKENIETVDGTPMVLPLGGFHDQLLMRKQEPQLNIEDPIGLPGQKELAERIHKALNGLHPATPMPDNAFHPVRSGEIVIERLRVIDTFGRSHDWKPEEVHTTRRMAARRQAKDKARLPMRLSQPARLNFRWLSASHEDVESNAHPASSPICGWFLPNDLDGDIAVYQQSGEMLGTVVEKGVWEPAPGSKNSPRSWREIENRNLARAVRWLTTPSENDLTGSFLETLDAALHQIDPSDAARHQARSLLVCRPIALVRARISLSLLHHAALDQSMKALRHRITTGAEDNHKFTDVRFPIRLGEHGQLNDGLCGYWVEEGSDFRDGFFHTPHGLNTGTSHERIKTPEEDLLTSYPLTVSLNDKPLTVSLLLDPRGSVHATTGILPVKSIAIPPDYYQNQLASLRVTFKTAPILTPAG